MLLLGCISCWMLACSVVGTSAAVGAAWLYGCAPVASEGSPDGASTVMGPIESGLPTCNAVLVGCLVALQATEHGPPWASLVAAAITSAATTVLGLVANRKLGGFLRLGTLPGLAVVLAYSRGGAQALLDAWLLRYPLLQHDLHGLVAPALDLHSRVMSPLVAVGDHLLSVPISMAPGIGGVLDGIGSYAFAPGVYALPLTLIWLLAADPAIPAGMWAGCAAGLTGEGLRTILLGSSDGISLAGLNGSLAFVVVDSIHFRSQRTIRAPMRRSSATPRQLRTFAVAAAVACAAGAGAGPLHPLGGTASSCLVLIGAELVDKVAGLWTVQPKKVSHG
jgi:hypothetical protein